MPRPASLPVLAASAAGVASVCPIPPRQEGGHRHHQQRKREAGGIFFCQFRQTRFLRQGAVEQFHDVRQSRLAANLFRLDDERAGQVERACGNTAACTFGHGQAFAREHGFVDFAVAAQNHAVHRHGFARAHHHRIARFQRNDGEFFALFVVQIDDFMAERGNEFDQTFRRVTRLVPCRLLHKPAGQQEKHEHGNAFKIHALPRVADKCGNASHERQQNGDGDRRVHAGAAVAQITQRADKERLGGIKDGGQHHQEAAPMQDGQILRFDVAV